MGEARRTTKLPLNFLSCAEGGMNAGKREHLETTAEILDRARAFYVDFFLAHSDKLSERVTYFSKKHREDREGLLSANKLRTWAEFHTVATEDHPNPLEGWDFGARFPGMPAVYRRSVIKDAIGKARSYLSNLKNWEEAGKKKGKPGLPTPTNHPALYRGTFELDLEELDCRDAFVRLKVYDSEKWMWENYPVKYSRWHEDRLKEVGWKTQSPKLILRSKGTELHIPQVKKVEAKRVKDSKKDPDLVTVGVDLNVKNLAVITVRQHGKIIKTVFVKDKGLDQHRYCHLKVVSKHQWQSGKPVAGEHADIWLWAHIRRTNQDFAHKVARAIADICKEYPGSLLLFERLRKIGSEAISKSRRLNRKLANQIRGLIRDYAKYKAFAYGTVTVEVNPHGTSQYCSRCGSKGERFSYQKGERAKEKGGKLFYCPVCQYEVNADFNASVNTHHSFYSEYHWQPQEKKVA